MPGTTDTIENIELREVTLSPEYPDNIRLALQAEDLLKGPDTIVDWEADRVFVALGNGALIGAANAVIGEGREAYLYGIVTIEDARRKGVGTLLMRHIIQLATDAGHSNIQLSPDSDTIDSQPRRFFEKFRFAPMPNTFDDFYQGRMILHLPAEQSS